MENPRKDYTTPQRGTRDGELHKHLYSTVGLAVIGFVAAARFSGGHLTFAVFNSLAAQEPAANVPVHRVPRELPRH
jgi:hypothetical protein